MWLWLGALLWAQKEMPLPEKVASYEVVGRLRDHKVGVVPAPTQIEAFSAKVLSKVGFYRVEGLSTTPEGELRCRLLVDPHLPLTDLQEVLRAAGLETFSFQPLENPKPTEK